MIYAKLDFCVPIFGRSERGVRLEITGKQAVCVFGRGLILGIFGYSEHIMDALVFQIRKSSVGPLGSRGRTKLRRGRRVIGLTLGFFGRMESQLVA